MTLKITELEEVGSLEDGVFKINEVHASEKMLAPTVPIDNSENVATNKAVLDYVDKQIQELKKLLTK